MLVACVGGGSNAIGLFHDFVDERAVRLVGIEAAGEGIDTDKHAATSPPAGPGAARAMSYVLQDEQGQVQAAHSLSAGLDYPGVGPEHSHLKDIGRAEYYSVTDNAALAALALVCSTEGIIPALETAHAFAYLGTLVPH